MGLQAERIALVFLGLLISIPASAEPLYTLTNLGAVLPQAINDSGDVAFSQAGVYHSYGSDAGQLTPPTAYGLGPNSIITGINDGGQIVGTLPPSNGTPQDTFVTEGGKPVTIPTPPGYQFSNGVAVNNSGDVIQSSTSLVGNGTSTAYTASVFQNGNLIDLGTPGSTFALTYPKAINDSGQITGGYNPSIAAPPHAFLFSNGRMIDLGTLGGQQSTGFGINDLGQVVGTASLPGSQFNQHAFLYSGGTMNDLGTLSGPAGESEASGINHSGQVVGESNGLAVVWNSGAISDLNHLLSANPPYTLIDATGINNLGQIIGVGYDYRNAQYDGFLLTPTDLPAPAAFTPIVAAPEPGTFAIFSLLGLGYVWHRAPKGRRHPS